MLGVKKGNFLHFVKALQRYVANMNVVEALMFISLLSVTTYMTLFIHFIAYSILKFITFLIGFILLHIFLEVESEPTCIDLPAKQGTSKGTV